MSNTNITIEEFHKSYRDYVLEWVKIQNKKWNAFGSYNVEDKLSRKNIDSQENLAAEDFYSIVVEKLFIKKKIDLFNDKHSSNAKFKTWLNILLKNEYHDQYRKKHDKYNKKKIDSLDGLLDEEGNEYLVKDDDLYKEEEYACGTDTQVLVQAIITAVNSISKLRYRVLVKLKLYIDEKIEFDNDEIEYLCVSSNFTEEKVHAFLKENIKKDGFGIKDKDIEKLTDFATGSINTTYQRIVRKLNLNSYNILKD